MDCNNCRKNQFPVAAEHVCQGGRTLLFNSYIFIFGFLPICLLIAGLLARLPGRLPYLWWLVAASLVFYSWQDIRLTVLFLTSVAFNYVVAGLLIRNQTAYRFPLMCFAVTANLLFIGYFKYFCFFVSSANEVFGTQLGCRQDRSSVGNLVLHVSEDRLSGRCLSR